MTTDDTWPRHHSTRSASTAGGAEHQVELLEHEDGTFSFRFDPPILPAPTAVRQRFRSAAKALTRAVTVLKTTTVQENGGE